MPESATLPEQCLVPDHRPAPAASSHGSTTPLLTRNWTHSRRCSGSIGCRSRKPCPVGAVAVTAPPGRPVSTPAVFSRAPAAKDLRSPAHHAAGDGSAPSGPLYLGRSALDRPLDPGAAWSAHGPDTDGVLLRPLDVPSHLSAVLESAVLSHAA